jgi:nitrite reductase/ring-hydroxylating ferredoxin subunit
MRTTPLSAVDTLSRMEYLDPWAKPLKNAVDRVVKPGPMKDLLTGRWLGHSVHPVLTDVPIGAWVCSAFLDVFGGKRSRDASDALIGLGILSALPTAAAGLSDWTDTSGRTRRLGMFHAAANTAAVGLFGLSLIARRRGHRGSGVMLSALGQGVLVGSAYLGGHLVYAKGIGVANTAFDQEPKRWTAVMREEALTDGKPEKVTAGEAPVFVYKQGTRIIAISDRCSHQGCSLATGDVMDGYVECGCHGSRFSLEDGSVLRGPATSPQPTYETRVDNGNVEVRLRSEP